MALAQRLAVTLSVSPNPVMAQDFNPRNWHVTRAQCEVLAGGVVASPVTKSFLETSPAYAETGWSFVLPQPLSDLRGRRVAVLTAISGLDRIGLGRYLRAQEAEVTITPNAAAFTQALREKRADVGVTEHLLAGQIAAHENWRIEWSARGASALSRRPRPLERRPHAQARHRARARCHGARRRDETHPNCAVRRAARSVARMERSEIRDRPLPVGRPSLWRLGPGFRCAPSGLRNYETLSQGVDEITSPAGLRCRHRPAQACAG